MLKWSRHQGVGWEWCLKSHFHLPLLGVWARCVVPWGMSGHLTLWPQFRNPPLCSIYGLATEAWVEFIFTVSTMKSSPKNLTSVNAYKVFQCSLAFPKTFIYTRHPPAFLGRTLVCLWTSHPHLRRIITIGRPESFWRCINNLFNEVREEC
jgi:hypothetical protein